MDNKKEVRYIYKVDETGNVVKIDLYLYFNLKDGEKLIIATGDEHE